MLILGGGCAGSCSLSLSNSSLSSGSGWVMRVRMILRPSSVVQMHIDHLECGELLQHTARRESRRERMESLSQRDVQTISQNDTKMCASTRCSF